MTTVASEGMWTGKLNELKYKWKTKSLFINYSSLLKEALKEPYMNNPRRNRGFGSHTTIISSERAEYISYGKYISSGMIPYSRSSFLYSSSNDILLWCSCWFIIYSINLSISLIEQVKEPYPTAHPLKAGKKLLLFIHIEDDTLMSLTKSTGAIDGFISVRIWRWFSTPFMRYKWLFLCFIIHVIYAYRSLTWYCFMVGKLSFVLKTIWYRCWR